jgi:hypothetical protein
MTFLLKKLSLFRAIVVSLWAKIFPPVVVEGDSAYVLDAMYSDATWPQIATINERVEYHRRLRDRYGQSAFDDLIAKKLIRIHPQMLYWPTKNGFRLAQKRCYERIVSKAR